jgi:gluconate 2-dehydrogenase gamma chain
MNENSTFLTRRKAIQGAAALIGGTLTVAQLGSLASRAAVAATENSPPLFFDRTQFSIIERVVDLIIPETDTPGAHAAGVHHLIDLMLAEWASPERQARYVQGLQDLDARAKDNGAEDFASASAAQQLQELLTLDREAYAEGAPDTFFRGLKKLVLFGYYSSEAGATIELQYEQMPGDYRACMPIEDSGRAWFWLGFSHEL